MAVFCITYYICSYIAIFPAIIKLLRTRSSNDYSLLEVVLSMIAITSWTIYIFSTKQDFIVYVGTVLDQVLYTVWNGLVVIFYKKE
jgi:uncharacterized protein with PQ loop repeat